MNKNSAVTIIRRASKALLVVILLLSITSFSVVRWTEDQFLNTNNWVNTVGPLPKDPVIASAMGLYITNQVFASVDVQQKIAESLPPKASFIAGPIAEQLKDMVKKVSTKAVSSDAFQAIWTTANRRVLDSQLKVARGEKQPLLGEKTQKLNINIAGIKQQITSKLGGSSVALPALTQDDKQPLAIVADLQVAPKLFQRTVKQIDFIHSLLPYVIVSSFLGVLAVSINRARTAFRLAIVFIAIYLVKIISLKITKDQLLGNVTTQAYVPALSRVFDALTMSLVNIIYFMIAIFIGILAISYIGGTTDTAKKIRQLLKLNKLTEIDLYSKLIGTRPLIKQNIWKLVLGFSLLALILLALSSAPTIIGAIKALLMVITISTILYIFANPRRV